MTIFNNKLIFRPVISIGLVILLLIATSSVIYYVQSTLSEIEEALPITLSRHERNIRVLVNDMDRLVQNIGFARSRPGSGNFELVVKQTLEVEKSLEKVRENYRFNDALGISAIHATLNPAIFDIKSWLTQGIYSFEPRSPQTLQLVERRAREALYEAEKLLLLVGETAINELTAQARRIEDFRNVMILTLATLAIMTLIMVMLGFRLQRMILALKESEEQIRFRANYDSLTKLPNRANFIEQLGESITRDRRKQSQSALMFIDLDRFKTINDTLGHDVGDELIVHVAKRIRGAVRETDLISRFGGDEFTLLLGDVNGEIHASIVAKSILERLSDPFMLAGHEIYSSASIGITLCPDDGEDANTLLKNADMAMYEAKNEGRNRFRFFTSQMTLVAQQFLELDKDMRRALSEGEFYLDFQPIYDLPDQSLAGLEALLRWQHPVKGLIPPIEFIAVAEETGLIEEIGLWVIRRACTEVLPWLSTGLPEGFYLSVNVSIRQFKGGFDSHQLNTILQETGFPADRLLLEMTESLLMDGDRRFKEVLSEIRAMGVRLAVDDFGTGFSALSYLREFPVNTLKIDRSFIRDIVQDSGDRRLVDAIITMAHGLGLLAVAEGVETAEQGALLAALKCDMVQGNYYCRPANAEKIKRLFLLDNGFSLAANIE